MNNYPDCAVGIKYRVRGNAGTLIYTLVLPRNCKYPDLGINLLFRPSIEIKGGTQVNFLSPADAEAFMKKYMPDARYEVYKAQDTSTPIIRVGSSVAYLDRPNVAWSGIDQRKLPDSIKKRLNATPVNNTFALEKDVQKNNTKVTVADTIITSIRENILGNFKNDFVEEAATPQTEHQIKFKSNKLPITVIVDIRYLKMAIPEIYNIRVIFNKQFLLSDLFSDLNVSKTAQVKLCTNMSTIGYSSNSSDHIPASKEADDMLTQISKLVDCTLYTEYKVKDNKYLEFKADCQQYRVYKSSITDKNKIDKKIKELSDTRIIPIIQAFEKLIPVMDESIKESTSFVTPFM